MQPSPEEEIDLRAAASGDASAFSRLAALHSARLLREATAWCGDAHLAEDLVQETLIEAWRGLRRFDASRCRLSTWLHAILFHRHLKAVRRARSRLPLASALGADGTNAPEQPSAATTPADDLLQQEEAARVRDAVAALPGPHREVVQLRFLAGASLEEIATALGCSLGTVKSRLHYGLEKLREMPAFVNPPVVPRE